VVATYFSSESILILCFILQVFVIAHRLETVRRADRIFLLDGGELVEEGTHSTLLAKGGQYASLYCMQEHSTMRKTPSQTF
jgi:ABC-type multidrug transport system fused ATPase/permease subunit